MKDFFSSLGYLLHIFLSYILVMLAVILAFFFFCFFKPCGAKNMGRRFYRVKENFMFSASFSEGSNVLDLAKGEEVR